MTASVRAGASLGWIKDLFGGRSRGRSESETVNTWFIDPVNGDDANSGTWQFRPIPRPGFKAKVPDPLKTHEALRKKIGQKPIEGAVEVRLLNDFPADNPIIIDFTLGAKARLTYLGVKPLTKVVTGKLTQVVPIHPETNQALEVQAQFYDEDEQEITKNWGPLGLVNSSADLPEGQLRRIRLTSGPDAGAIAYACKDLGSQTARMSPFGHLASDRPGPPTARLVKELLIGTEFVVESGFVLIDSFAVDIKVSPIGNQPPSVHVLFKDLELNPNKTHNHQVRALAQPVHPGPGTIGFTGCGVGRLAPQYANKVQFDFCRLGGTWQSFQATLVQVTGCCCLGEIVVFEGARVVGYAHTIFQGGALRLQGLARLGDVAFYDTTDPGGAGLQVEGNGTARVEPFFSGLGGGKAIYGSGHAGFGAKVRAGGCLIYDGPANGNARSEGITVSGGAGTEGKDVDVAGTQSTWLLVAPDLVVANRRAGVVPNT